MARVEGGAVILDTDWPGIKLQIDTKNINFKYEEDDTAYSIFAIDGQYFYQTVIYKSGQAPQNQSTYDTWRSEFEADYKNRVTDFTSTQPFYLSNEDGYSVVLKDGASPTANDGYGIAIIGYDGSNYRMARTDSSGRQVLVGAGTAGSPVGGLITIQGAVGAIDVPISGTVTANAGSGNFAVVQATASNLLASVGGLGAAGAAPTGNPVLIAGSDGSAIRNIRTANDGTIRIDPTGTTIQPISGTVTANAGTGTFTVAGTVTANIGTTGGLALDSTLAKLTIAPSTAIGSNTLAMVGGHVTTVSPTYTNGNINPLSLTTAGALRIDGSGVTQPVSDAGGSLTIDNSTLSVVGGGTEGTALRVTIANDSTGVLSVDDNGTSLTVDTGQLPAALVGGRLDTNIGAWLGSTVPTVGQKTMANSIPITIASDQTVIPVSQSGTWTVQQGTPPWSVVGPGADGAAVTGNPVRIGGSDGTNTQDIITDTSGRLLVSGAAADGATVTGNPVLIGGQDGTNAQSILTDTSGRQIVVGAAADGAAVTGNPVLIGGTDGTNAQTAELRNTHPAGDVQGIIVRNIEATNPTFYAVFDRITLSANKYLATLFNTSSTRKVAIQRIWVLNWQFDTVVGGNGDSILWKITARTAGTTVDIRAADSADSLSSGIAADTNSTVVTQDHLIMRIMHSGDESNLANANWINASTFPSNALRYERKAGTRGLTLRQNQGVSLQWITGDADGTWSIVYEFTDEVV